jgi:hypothetical protein
MSPTAEVRAAGSGRGSVVGAALLVLSVLLATVAVAVAGARGVEPSVGYQAVQCPPGYQLDPQNTQRCIPMGGMPGMPTAPR